MLRSTIVNIRKLAKFTNEKPAITALKLKTVRAHDMTLGNVAICYMPHGIQGIVITHHVNTF
jgi:hypothetical protein